MQSVSARLVDLVAGMETYLIWGLRETLEEVKKSDVQVLVASQWCIYTAGKMQLWCTQPQEQLIESQVKSLSTGPLAEGLPWGFSRQRWRFWFDRLGKLVEETEDKMVKARGELALDCLKKHSVALEEM